MKCIYTGTDPIEADLLRSWLRNEGVETTLDNEFAWPYINGMPTPAIPLEISVADGDAAPALEMLRHYFAERGKEAIADPELPPPLSPEESAQFEVRVRRGAWKRRFGIATCYLLPPATTVPVLLALHEWEGAAMAAAMVWGLAAFGWAINLIAEGAVAKDQQSSA
jgi:hypothetical protein